MEKRKLNMSLGNPLHPFRSVARHAFREASKDLNQYRFMNRGSGDPEIRRVYHAVSDYFTNRGIYPPHWTGLPFDHFSLMGGGTTEGYNLVIQLLIQDVIYERQRMNRTIKPAILMPVPTYGFFMHPPEQWGIEVIPVARDITAGSNLTKQQLLRAVKEAHKRDLRIIAYFDSNPNNPLGTIRCEARTRELAEVFLALREHYRRADERALEKWQETQPSREISLLDKPFKIKPGHLWDGRASRVRIIDDMVYDGLEYGDKKAFAFAQIPELYKDTFTLAGPSKAGLANLRGGVVIAHSDDIGALERLRINNNYFPSRPTLAALEAFYSVRNPFAAAREKHMAHMNANHRFHGLFMKALVNGMDRVREITPEDREKIINTYARLESCPPEKAERALNRGIKGVRIITTPEAGFFHLVDFSALRDGTYQSPHNHWQHDKPFKDDHSLIDILETGQNISSCNASWMGLPADALISRATFAIPLEDILEYARRLRQAVRTITPQNISPPCCAATKPAPAL